MISYQIFGESHGAAVGVVLEGLPAGILFDEAFLKNEMERRRAAGDGLSTARIEPDIPRVLSGIYRGKTTGTPLCAIIENTNTRPEDYAGTENLARPSHGDYTGFVRYQGCNDPRGGGHFSGRLTAPLVFAGALAKLVLREKDIFVGAHIARIGTVEDRAFDPVKLAPEDFAPLWETGFSVLDAAAGERMKAEIRAARAEADSVGGIIECGVTGIPAGIGEPGLSSLEGVLARHLFAVPAVKGVEFGVGFAFAELRGSTANDPMRMENGRVVTETNQNGGILGGISNGMPLIFRVAIKPTPSIGQPQRTVELSRMENAQLCIHGRHDPCILARAAVVVESAAALGICEAMTAGDCAVYRR